jgi:hypothetical protein
MIFILGSTLLLLINLSDLDYYYKIISSIFTFKLIISYYKQVKKLHLTTIVIYHNQNTQGASIMFSNSFKTYKIKSMRAIGPLLVSLSIAYINTNKILIIDFTSKDFKILKKICNIK